MSLGIALSVGIAEFATRLLIPTPQGPFAHNPIIQKQANDVDLFEADEELGHRLKRGRFIGVYRNGLITADEISQDPMRKGKLFVLSIGDSSTSGWNSDVVVENAQRHSLGEPLRSPFQTYRTYSDILAEAPRLYVVNAGVPGFTSLQGSRYLERLLEEFDSLGIRIDVVTVYFGNNDSAWNGNIQDKYVLPSEGLRLQLLRIADQSTGSFRVVPRVSAADYTDHVTDMIQTCREAGADIVLVEPAIPKYWMPGLRATSLEDKVTEQYASLEGSKVQELLYEARDSYKKGCESAEASGLHEAEAYFVEAQEMDFIVPRIKRKHVSALQAVAEQEDVPLVSVAGKIPIDDRNFFLDYCHPIEPANEMIAEGILEEVEYLWSRRRR